MRGARAALGDSPVQMATSASSSSAGMPQAASSGSQAAGRTDESSASNATLVPHESRVYLDQIGERMFALTNTTTLERRDLPVGHWELEFDNEGYGILIGSEGSEPASILVEEFMARKLYEKDSGEFIVVDARQDPGADTYSLDLLTQKYVESFMDLVWGPNKQKLRIAVCILRWPRQEARTFLSFADLYVAFGLDSYDNQWSKWAWTGWPRWQSYLNSLGLKGHLLQSTMNKGAHGETGDLGRTVAILPAASGSVWAVMALCLRWGSPARTRGTLAKAEHRTVAMWMLASLIRAACELKAWHLEIRFAEPWENRNPRPEKLAPSIMCPVSTDGNIDLRPWRTLATQEPDSIAGGWFRRLAECVSNMTILPLLALVQVISSDKRLMSANFLGQVLWRIGVRLELVCMAGFSRGVTSSVLTMPRAGAIESLTKSRFSVQDAFCVKYLFNAQEMSRNRRTMSIATDKSTVHGLPLQDTILVYPDNMAVVCPPTATPGGMGVGRGAGLPTPTDSRVLFGYGRAHPSGG